MAAEGAPVAIAANVIAPYAKTRPGSGFGPIPWSEELQEWLHPRLVAPLVGWLAHPDCPANGECFTVGAGHVGRVELVLHEGVFDRDATIETLAARAEEVLGGPTSAITAFDSRAVELMMSDFHAPPVA